MNKWLRYVGIISAVGAIGLGILWLRREAILEASLEQGLTAATGVNTQIDDLDVKLFDGEFNLNGITFSNPKGFSAPYLLRIDRLELQIKMGTLLQRPIKVPLLGLDGVDLNVEQASTRNNLMIVIDNLGKPLLDRKQSAVDKGILVNIDRLSIRDIDATFNINAFGVLKFSKVLEINDINLTDVDSKDSEGKLEGALTAAVINAIFAEISDDITGDNLTGDDKSPLGDIPIKLPF